MRLLIASLLLMAAGSAGQGQADLVGVGPAVGAPVTAFSLVDHQGRAQSLASVAGPKGTMLVFFRSADW
ncbi:MAG TPA: hypothetical protein VMN81_02800 [Vicinamibacterales bacterium]|nr:hypothetical protein [Vicinamibacterales bacterium]